MDKIKYNRDIGLADPVMIAGWPGMGSVALGVVDYMQRKLGAVKFAEIEVDPLEVIDSVVVGIGLNVNIKRADFDPAYRETATSLWEETGRDHSREDLLLLVCERFEAWYEIFLRDGFVPVSEGWLARAEMAGKRIRVLFRDEVREGEFAGIDRDGALLIADEQGAVSRITAGDATIMKGVKRCF